MFRLVLLLVMLGLPAQAHGTLPGGGGFYSGALHPLVAIEHLLLLLTGGLILGRDGLRWPLLALGLGVGVRLWSGVAVAGMEGVLPTTTKLRSARIVERSGDFSASTKALFSLAITAGGVFAGARMACQFVCW